MPLTSKGKKIMSAMKEQYGSEKGKRVFYASKNKGRISGVDRSKRGHSNATDTMAGRKKHWNS